MCWDAAHGYVLMFSKDPLNGMPDTWSWNGSSWTHRFATQPTVVGFGSSAIAFHAPTNEVLLVHEGNTWTWTGTDWLLRNAVRTPPHDSDQQRDQCGEAEDDRRSAHASARRYHHHDRRGRAVGIGGSGLDT
ncbi:MAG: hypothetical protein Q7T30_04515 [Planctomycetota bacterium]|nr:hypothetical protein [Planctomycetota bacterium]